MANQDKPAILNVNIGTTVKGAVDDLDKVGKSEGQGAWDRRRDREGGGGGAKS